MLSFTTNVQIYLCTAATDRRTSSDGLSALVASAMNQDVLSGHLFLFLNRRLDRIKLLWWLLVPPPVCFRGWLGFSLTSSA